MPNPPTVAAYLPEFLKLDMQHVYRQISALETMTCHVFTHKRENERRFPYHPRRLHLLPKARLRWWRRWVALKWRQEPWVLFDWELRRWILELTRVDAGLLHVYFGHMAPQFRPLMKAWPHPVVVSFHGADAGVNMDKPGYLKAMREVFDLGALMLCRSESLMRDLQALGCPAEKTALWRTGLPVEEWPFVPREVPADGAWRLIQVCRFVDKKGLDLTLEAFAAVRQRFPAAQLTLVGDGPVMPALRAQAERLGLTGAVTFTGFVGQARVKKMLYEAHAFVHPSRTSVDGNREGIPNAALEAMASGLPVIGTDHGGFPEAVTDGVSGLLVPENRADRLAEALLAVLGEAELRGRLAAGGRREVETKFDREQQVRVLEGHYKSLIVNR